MTKENKSDNLRIELDDLTADLQRTRADFENYRKRVETEKQQARDASASVTIMRLLPVIDNIDRALKHLPDDLKENSWAKSVVSLQKNLDKSLKELGLNRIEAEPGGLFNPNLHEAISMEDGKGDLEVIAEELQPGYMLNGNILRHSLVKVTHIEDKKQKKKESK